MSTSRRFAVTLTLLFTLMIWFVCTGCGGRGLGGGGGGVDGTRAVVLAEIEAKFATFDGADPDLENQQMLAFLNTKAQFEEAGISASGGVWARFTDGTTLVIANNIEPNPDLPGRLQSTQFTLPTRANGLPTSTDTIVANGFGDAFAEANQDIIAMFATQTYSVLDPLPTVDLLKSFNDLGVLYLASHGCSSPIVRGGPEVYIVWTGTKWVAPPPGQPDRYAVDMRDGSLTYFMGKTFHEVGNTAVVRIETHYGFTSKFVKKYWTGKFNANSFIYMNACSSASLKALEFELACLQAGASVYVGWTDTMLIVDGIVSGAYLFDRMLGTNLFDPETPPQRAFGYQAVLVEMMTHQRPDKPTMYDETIPPKTGRTAKLQMLTLNSNFGQLAPSIEVLAVDEQKDELSVYGVFGDGRGDVTMNGHPMTIKSWTANQIVCVLQRTGADASGDVQVYAAVPRQISNVIQLTEWRSNLTCTYDGDGTLSQIMEFSIHFRADVHDRRVQPHQDPFRIDSGYLQALDTTGTFITSGTYTSPDGLTTETWSGSGSIPSFIRPPEGTSPPEVNNVVVQGGFDADRDFRMAIRGIAKAGNRIHTVIRDTQGVIVSDRTEDVDAIWLSVDDLNGNPTLVRANLDFTVPGGTKNHAINLEESLTLTWSTMAAVHPPAADSARSRAGGSRRRSP